MVFSNCNVGLFIACALVVGPQRLQQVQYLVIYCDVFLYFLSGVGGQIDFLRGAALGHDGLGKPILALNSVTKRGESKIVPFLKEGT